MTVAKAGATVADTYTFTLAYMKKDIYLRVVAKVLASCIMTI